MLRSYLKQDSHNIFHTFEEVGAAVRDLIKEVESAKEESAAAVSSVASIAAALVSGTLVC